MPAKFHRDAEEIPTDPNEKRKLIQWLLDHPLWTHPVKIFVPPDDNFEEHFEKCEKGFRLRFYGDPGTENWVESETVSGGFHGNIEIDVVYVNPATERIEKDITLNTAFRVWIEAGGWYDMSQDKNVPIPDKGWDEHNRWVRCHDINLDCGAADLESAILELAIRVKFYYGEGRKLNDREICDLCSIGEDGYCVKCGFEAENPTG